MPETLARALRRGLLTLHRTWRRCARFGAAGIDEAEKIFQGNRKAAGGLVTSLQNKGMGQLDEEYDQFILSDAGIDAAFSA